MMIKLIGPFKQILSLATIPLKGAISDDRLQCYTEAGILIEGDKIIAIDNFERLSHRVTDDANITRLQGTWICTPGYIDCHTHIAFSGNRANDFALRNAGVDYLDIAQAGGGIWSTVYHTRQTTEKELTLAILNRVNSLLAQGITTIEIKSGYGLSVKEELKMLRAIKTAQQYTPVDLIPTCLAAHMKPKDYKGKAIHYLSEIVTQLFPILKAENLTKRIDAFVEQTAFSATEIKPYLQTAKSMGFDITIHADQFSTSGSALAVELGAVSADHLEVSTKREIALLAASDTIAVALPGASLGLGCGYTPARQLLDEGASLAIATDWNPGSAPMGQLVTQAAILAAAEKLTNAELFAALTFRAAKALNLTDRGRLTVGELADFSIYHTDNYQNISYRQGSLQPEQVWKRGKQIFNKGA